MKAIFLVSTNGYDLKVVKCRPYLTSEIIFDATIEELREFDTAYTFYENLNFEVVVSVKEMYRQTAETLPHEKYVLLEKSLRNYPELQAILDQGDFEPFTEISGDCLIIVRPKVSIRCELSSFLDICECEIKFSSILRRGLKINLSHRHILESFMIGVETEPDWGTRPFILSNANDAFTVRLGATITTLSGVEVRDLCLCMDQISQKYKNLALDLETSLKSQDYPFYFSNYLAGFRIHDGGGLSGFHVLSVQRWLWDLIKRFVGKHHNRGGEKTKWHIFEFNTLAIRVETGHSANALFLPVAIEELDSSNLLSSVVNVIYWINKTYFHQHERCSLTSWQMNVGSTGIWTVDYAKKWFLEELTPEVYEHYSEEFHRWETLFYKNPSYSSSQKRVTVPYEEVKEPKQLALYVRKVQEWFSHPYNIAASSLREYYETLINLCKRVDFSTFPEIHYVVEKLYALERRFNGQDYRHEIENLGSEYIIKCLEAHRSRIAVVDYEKALDAYRLTTVLVTFLEEGSINYSQAQFNLAKKAVFPLWQQSRFETKYVYSQIDR